MRKLALSMALGLSVAVTSVFAPLSQEAHAASTQTPWQNLTPSQLTAVWWQWLLSIRASISPVIDPTGANAYSGPQPYSSLLFLAGTFTSTTTGTGDVVGEVTRTIKVKQGTALFFPLINTEVDNVGCTPRLGGPSVLCPFPQTPPQRVLGVPQLQAVAAALIDPASGLFAQLRPCSNATCTTLGLPLPGVTFARLQSLPFHYTLPATDNLIQSFGINVSGTVAPVVADGYYSLVPGKLASGYYQLQFGGQFPINSVPNFS